MERCFVAFKPEHALRNGFVARRLPARMQTAGLKRRACRRLQEFYAFGHQIWAAEIECRVAGRCGVADVRRGRVSCD